MGLPYTFVLRHDEEGDVIARIEELLDALRMAAMTLKRPIWTCQRSYYPARRYCG
jgi:hypothetical protein